MATSPALQVPPLNKRKRIPMRAIRAIVSHIAEKFDPEKEFEILADDLRELDRYAVIVRYPGIKIDMKTAEQA
jgi:hypothetical protein